MTQLLEAAWADHVRYVGSGLYMYFAYASMIYIIVKDKRKRVVLGILPLVIVLLFFNPLFVKGLYYKYFFATYWRILWLVPSTIVNAYVATELIFKYKSTAYRIGAFAGAVLLVVLGGKLIYNRGNFSKRSNWYKIPGAVIEIGYNINNYAAHWYPIIIVPNELYTSMRQYSSQYRLLYGRDAEGYMSGIDNPQIQAIYEEMCKEEPDVELIINYARQNEVHTIVFNMDTQVLTKDPEDYGCQYTGDTANYRYYVILYDEEN